MFVSESQDSDLYALPVPSSGTAVVGAGLKFHPSGASTSFWTPIDLDANRDDRLLVCVTQEGSHGLKLLDPFPEDAPVSFTLPGPCDAVEVADFDGDGDPEIAVGTESRLLILDPSTWTVLAEHVGTLNPLEDDLGYALDSADLNGDGRMDLVVGAPRVGRVYILTRVIP